MADLLYNATYKERTEAPNLVAEVCSAVRSVLPLYQEQGIEIRECSHPNFSASFRANSEDSMVLFGVKRGIPSKLEGVEGVVVSFSGRDTDVIRFKNSLLQKVPNLKLE